MDFPNSNKMKPRKLFFLFLIASALQAIAQEPLYVGGDISLLPTYEEHGAIYMDKDGKRVFH